MRSERVPYPVFRAALDAGDVDRGRALAARMTYIGLGDALLLRHGDEQRYDRAAVRWLGRFALEARGATLKELQEAAAALDALPTGAEAAMDALSTPCLRHGLGDGRAAR